jgi:hypothetical protein
MTPTRAALYVGVGSVLIAWLASGASVRRHEDAWRAPALTPVPTAGTEALGDEVRQQTTRLAERLAAAPSPRVSSRNPFAFGERRRLVSAASRGGSAPAPGVTATLAPPPPEPRIELIGMAERTTADGVVRTAMLLADGETLLMVSAGETIGGRFRVAAVSPTTVDLADLVRGGTRRLTLR